MTDAFFRLPPVRSRCRRLTSHWKKSMASAWASMVNRFSLAAMTACMNSWGETWPLKARAIHILRTRDPNSRTSGDLQSS